MQSRGRLGQRSGMPGPDTESGGRSKVCYKGFVNVAPMNVKDPSCPPKTQLRHEMAER